jgi:hypothetical protein
VSRFRGVSPHKEGGFVSSIGHLGKHCYLGWFREFEEAKQARLDAEIRLFGATFDRREVELADDHARIPLHGQRGVFKGWALIDLADLDQVRDIAWTLDPRGYVVGRPPGASSSVTMHRFLVQSATLVDHRNRDKLDNRRANLRNCTPAENSRNTGIPANNTSGSKGVTRTASGRWRARIWMDWKEVYLGTFDTREAAELAYDKAAVEMHGQFASPNAPTPGLSAEIELIELQQPTL